MMPLTSNLSVWSCCSLIIEVGTLVMSLPSSVLSNHCTARIYVLGIIWRHTAWRNATFTTFQRNSSVVCCYLPLTWHYFSSWTWTIFTSLIYIHAFIHPHFNILILIYIYVRRYVFLYITSTSVIFYIHLLLIRNIFLFSFFLFFKFKNESNIKNSNGTFFLL